MEPAHAFTWPPSYQVLRDEGWFDPRGFDLRQDPTRWTYLWLGDIEWLSSEEVEDYVPEPGQSDRLVPFAHTGAHDWWGFYLDAGNAMPVTLCLHDEAYGTYYAPTVESALFRLILDFASGDDFGRQNRSADERDFTLERARAALALWRRVLGRWFLPDWINEVDRLMTLPFKVYQPFATPTQFDHNVLITPLEAKKIFCTLVEWDLMDQEFKWQD